MEKLPTSMIIDYSLNPNSFDADKNKMKFCFPEEAIRAVAHDLRNPLGGIFSLLNLFIEDGEFDSEQLETLTLIKETAFYSLKLVDNLLKYEQPDEPDYHNINEIVTSCIKILSDKSHQKNQHITFSTYSQSVISKICRGKITRILDNLISNAIKFTPSQGKISIVIAEQEDNIQISVQDNGVGIPENLQQHLFDAPDKTRRAGTNGEQSFGLGLPICRKIIEENGGSIWFDSVPGENTTFYFTIPKVKQVICEMVA